MGEVTGVEECTNGVSVDSFFNLFLSTKHIPLLRTVFEVKGRFYIVSKRSCLESFFLLSHSPNFINAVREKC